MTRRGIGVGVHYLSIPEHPAYQAEFGWRPEDYPHAMRIGRQTVSLPLSAKLTDEEVSRVIEAVRLTLSAKSKEVRAKKDAAAPQACGTKSQAQAEQQSLALCS